MSHLMLFFIVMSYLEIIFSFVVIPFKVYVQNYAKNPVNQSVDDVTRLVNEWHTVHLFSKLKVGNPNQEVSLQINVDSNCFELNRIKKSSLEIEKLSYFFSNEENDANISLFNVNNSKTFKNVSEQYPKYYFTRDFFMGNDEIYLYNNLNVKDQSNEIKTNNLFFKVFNDRMEVNCVREKCGLHLGIQMFQEGKVSCPNFNKVLKESKLINKYLFSIHYDSQKSGSLIYGAYPHEYYPDKYKEQQLITFYTTVDPITITNFNIFPDQIISVNPNKEEFIVSTGTKVIFELYYGFFIGDGLYQDFIEKNFFNELIERNICQKNEKVPYGYYFTIKNDVFSCNEENLEDIKKFPELKFYIKTTNTSFVFGFDDLFIKIGNKYYFMVIFESYKNIYWILGYPFFKKYDIVFNEDSKTISYYTNNIPEENKGESIALKIVLIIFLGLILVAGLIVLGYYIGKYKFFIRKRKANELTDDDYEYKEGGNIN
jgi:hypothetical protein